MFSLTASLPFLKIITQSSVVTPAQTKLYPNSQGQDPSPNTQYCSYLGNGNRIMGPTHSGSEWGNCIGLLGQRYPGSLRDSLIPTPTLKP